MQKVLLIAVLALLAAYASTQRTLSYNAGMPDADVWVGEDRYQVWFHDTDQTVLVLRGEPRPLGQLMAQNMTVYANDRSPGTVNHDFSGSQTNSRIDWILVGGPIRTQAYVKLDERVDGRYPSDHYPVMADLELR